MTRVYLIFAGTIAGLLLVLGLWAWGQEGHRKAASAVAEARVIATQRDAAKSALSAFKAAAARDAELVKKRLAVAAQQQAAAERRAKDLQDALRNSPTWAAQPIPDGVRRALEPDAGAPDGAPAVGGPSAEAVPAGHAE